MRMTRADILTTAAACVLVLAGVWAVLLAWRDSEAKHIAAREDRAILHAEAEVAARDRVVLHNELRAAVRARSDLERRAARLEKNDVEFRKYATAAHGETHRLLGEVLKRLGPGAP